MVDCIEGEGQGQGQGGEEEREEGRKERRSRERLKRLKVDENHTVKRNDPKTIGKF